MLFSLSWQLENCIFYNKRDITIYPYVKVVFSEMMPWRGFGVFFLQFSEPRISNGLQNAPLDILMLDKLYEAIGSSVS